MSFSSHLDLLTRIPATRVHTALADAWEAEGELRAPFGGGAAALPGVRVMASGLPYPQWNGGDVHDPDFDMDAVRSWYTRRGRHFGLRVPAGMEWRHGGRKVNRQRCMALAPDAFRPAAVPQGVTLRQAGPDDLETYAYVDAEAFGDTVERTRQWCAPQLNSRDPRFTLLLALTGEEPAGVATCVQTASGTAAIFGVGVLGRARRRGIGSALTSHLTWQSLQSGAQLVVLNPETPAASRLYTNLGFVETGGLDIYMDL